MKVFTNPNRSFIFHFTCVSSIKIDLLQLKLYKEADTIDSQNYDDWHSNHVLTETVGHIPEVVKEGPLAEVDGKVTRPLEEMVEALKLVEANLQEYRESIQMDSDFYLWVMRHFQRQYSIEPCNVSHKYA